MDPSSNFKIPATVAKWTSHGLVDGMSWVRAWSGLFVLSTLIVSDWSRGQRSVTPPHNVWVSGTFLTHPIEKEFNHIRSGDS
ncbi:hypothetical protein TNCV_1931671 [Trichonephila clavipes]|nr:hypothetical protein TNCV_1931671 [Trichonephila clavipes]